MHLGFLAQLFEHTFVFKVHIQTIQNIQEPLLCVIESWKASLDYLL